MSREKLAYQLELRVGVTSSKTGRSDILQDPGQMDNIVGLRYLTKLGNKESKNLKVVKRNVELSIIKRDHNYSRVFSQHTENKGRSGVTSDGRQLRMDFLPKSISKPMSEIKNSISGSLRISDILSNNQICCLETRSIQYSNRYIANRLRS